MAESIRRTTLDAVQKPGAFDAIVVGAGAAGGLAALLLAEAGLKVLVLDAGWRMPWFRAPIRRVTNGLVRRLADPRALRLLPHNIIHHGRKALRHAGRMRQPIQRRNFAWDRMPEAFVDDVDCPYVTPPDLPFEWYRARQLGGRMVIPGHGRQYYRLSPSDFHPGDDLSPAWPLQPGELDPWYSQIERRLGLSGARDGAPWLPDSEIAHTLAPTPAEAALETSIVERWPGTRPLLGRYAPPLPGLDLASATGRLWCRQGAVVREIEIDAAGRARGVAFHDQQSRSELRVQAPLVFLCASALESTRILLLSHAPQTGRAPGAASGALGRNLMDHMVVQATGIGGGLVGEPVSPEVGRCVYVPRFDARNDPAPMGDRGFGVQVYQSSGLPGRSYLTAVAFAEMFPHPENRVTLDPARRDAWGVPALHIECRHTPADLEAVSKMGGALHELANVVGAKLSELQATPPGAAMHECGTARMGDDPASSVLDRHNHCWDARGLYLTDAASFPSQGAQNPTLTIMALTARACDHAING